MAENPEILVHGTVSRVQVRTKFNADPNAPREENGREVGILAKSGFLTVRIPKDITFEIAEDDEVVWAVDYNAWDMPDERYEGVRKRGVTLTFKKALTVASLVALEAAIAA